MTDPSVVACTLRPIEPEDRKQEWLAVLQDNLIESKRTDSGVMVRLHSSPTVTRALERLVAAENQCCP